MEKTLGQSALRLLVAGAIALAAALPALAQDQPPPPQAGPHKAPPRACVITFGKGDNQRDQQASKIQGLAEQILLEYKFPLVDEQQLIAGYTLDNLEKYLILSPERAKMAELKARFGCELLVVVQYTRNFQYEKEYFGAQSRYYISDVRVKAINADTAEIVFSGGGSTSIEARTGQLEQLVKDTMKQCAQTVLERWSQEAFGALPCQIEARGFKHDMLERLEKHLKANPAVTDLAERSFNGRADDPNSALIELKYNGGQEELRGVLTSCPDPQVDVVGFTPGKIVIAPVQKMTLSFVSPSDGALLGSPQVDVVVKCTGREAKVDLNGQAMQGGEAGSFRARITAQPGTNTLVARAKDATGRTAEARCQVLLDNEPPTVTILTPQSGLTNQHGMDVLVDAKDNSGQVQVTVNGQPAQMQADGRFAARVEIPEGASPIVAVATDKAGNRAQARVDVTCDSIPPNIDGKVVAIIEGRVDKPGTTVTCQGKPVVLNPDGSFRVEVEAVPGSSVTIVAIDPAGNRAEKVYPIGNPTPR